MCLVHLSSLLSLTGYSTLKALIVNGLFNKWGGGVLGAALGEVQLVGDQPDHVQGCAVQGGALRRVWGMCLVHL
ncbi:hypothetical protein T484DRAFT_1949532 [Baffinella frigidus]|nr:hypothetical protein T484DRAFT_1949532 [Cryptophyta sp. CCMP2293]